MSVITTSKRYEDIQDALRQRRDLGVVVLGCDKCAKISKTGGQEEVRSLRAKLSESGLTIGSAEGVVDAVEEGLCDPKAVSERLQPLVEKTSDIQMLVLSCGAGLKCVRDTLPGVRLVAGLDTLGPGVKGDLACLACGDCRFGEAGCKMLEIAKAQANRLSNGYPTR